MTQNAIRRPVSKFAFSLLRKLESGQRISLCAGGDGRLGSRTVPASLLRELKARDLIEAREGYAGLSSRGRSFMLREKSRRQKPVRGCPSAGNYQAQHGVYRRVREDVDGRAQTVLRNTAVDAVSWLSRRKGRDGKPLITGAQKMAAERMLRDFEAARLRQKMTASYDGIPRDRSPARAGAGYTPGEAAEKARKRLEGAMRAVGPGLNDILFRVCCNGEGLEAAETGLGWPRRSGRIVLQIALARLAGHYGLTDHT